MRKAFDSVDHDLLIHAIARYGMDLESCQLDRYAIIDFYVFDTSVSEMWVDRYHLRSVFINRWDQSWERGQKFLLIHFDEMWLKRQPSILTICKIRQGMVHLGLGWTITADCIVTPIFNNGHI